MSAEQIESGGVAAVVVTYNSGGTLRRCVDALLNQAEVRELIIVDNGSVDAWRAQLPSDARLRAIVNSDNPGFAAACNQGAAATESPWLLFINPDCFLHADDLDRLLRVAGRVAHLGALGVDLVDQHGRVDPASRRRTPTPAALLTGRLAVPLQSREAGDGDVFVPVDAISGALMLVPRAVFAAEHGFDEAYRLHCEDLDLCRRMLNADCAVGVASGIRVLHLKGTSSQTRPIWVEWQKHRGMLRYFRTFDAASTPAWLRIVMMTGIAARFPIAAARAWWRARRRAADV